MELQNASTRVALAALIHDLGKFAQRADSPITKEEKDTHIQLYCPHHIEGNWYSHHHAAYTALAFNVIEQHAPALIKGDMTPFASRDNQNSLITDSLINAAAKHHAPETFLQWIIATADRVASGFEREEFEKYNQQSDEEPVAGKNYLQARQLTLFEQIRLNKNDQSAITSQSLQWRYPLLPLSPDSLFPKKKQEVEPDNNQKAKKEYTALWEQFKEGLGRIPSSHKQSWPLWLDHFDTLWLTYTHAIPSATAFGTKPDVSLYDHSKATAALAVALWMWHHKNGTDNAEAVKAMASRNDWNTDKLILIQGDFFGIQDFIFAEGSQTNRHAAKLLRGRSFYVSLLMELAALKVMETLELPSTSQIINAAGKFLIVASNTPDTIEKLKTIRAELDQWFLENTYGIAGIGLVWQPATCNDFLEKKNEKTGFSELIKKLFAQLDHAKLHRFSLCEKDTCVLPAEPMTPCQWHGHMPSDGKGDGKSCAISRDQILIGKQLVQSQRILILKDQDIVRSDNLNCCELPIWGYRIAFTSAEAASGKFAPLIQEGVLRRCWDFSIPEKSDSPLWQGYARRNINGYIPRFDDGDTTVSSGKYGEISEEILTDLREDRIKTLNHLACEDRIPEKGEEKWLGQIALTTLKGDVDNLGDIFQRGLHNPKRNQYSSFAKMAALSRQINAFFAIWLPTHCKINPNYRNIYTVFAGGDDFFLIGPWLSTQKLAASMAENFKTYTADNPEIHFSAGMIMTKPGYPIHALAQTAEEALSKAKRHQGKNAVHLFKSTVSWNNWPSLTQAQQRISDLQENYSLTTSYLYSLFSLIDMAETENERIEASMWRSKLAYRTSRLLENGKNRRLTNTKDALHQIIQDIGEKGIAHFKGAYRIPLFNHFYRQR